MNNIRTYFFVFLAVFASKPPITLASNSIFWFGDSVTTMKSRDLSGNYVLSNGIFLCNPYAMSAFNVAFVRGGKCYILNSDLRRHQIGQLPILNGDRFFLFRNMEALKTLKVTILEGEKAVKELMSILPSKNTGHRQEQNREELLTEFEQSGDAQILGKLWRIQHGLEPGYKLPVVESRTHKYELIEKDAEYDLRVLSAVGKSKAMLEVERCPIAKTLTEFIEEMKHRTDQPFINPRITRPEEIPDLQYRQRYVDFLAALKVDTKQGEIAGTLYNLEVSFRTDAERNLDSLTEAGRQQLLDRVAPETISPEVARRLGDRFNLPFVYQNGKPIANLSAK